MIISNLFISKLSIVVGSSLSCFPVDFPNLRYLVVSRFCSLLSVQFPDSIIHHTIIHHTSIIPRLIIHKADCLKSTYLTDLFHKGFWFVTVRVFRRQGGWGAAALPTSEKFSKICLNRAEIHLKSGKIFLRQWIFYRAAPLSYFFPYAHVAN